MEVAQPRITELGFKVSQCLFSRYSCCPDTRQTTIGLFLGIALSLAAGRTYIRMVQTRKITVDDGFFYLAVAALIAGTTTCYVDIPYLYVQQNVDPSTTVITPAFIDMLLRSLKIQAATDVLLSTALFAVKFSFLFFFHGLLRRLRSLTIWWYCILVMMVPIAVIFILFIFIVCPYFDDRVLGESIQTSCFNGKAFGCMVSTKTSPDSQMLHTRRYDETKQYPQSFGCHGHFHRRFTYVLRILNSLSVY